MMRWFKLKQDSENQRKARIHRLTKKIKAALRIIETSHDIRFVSSSLQLTRVELLNFIESEHPQGELGLLLRRLSSEPVQIECLVSVAEYFEAVKTNLSQVLEHLSKENQASFKTKSRKHVHARIHLAKDFQSLRMARADLLPFEKVKR